MANFLTNAGRAIVSGRIKGLGTEPSYGAWGTGAGAASATSTGLSTESTQESRVAGTSSQQTTSVTNDSYRVVVTITCATAGKTITNAGLFDAATAGNLFLIADGMSLALNVGDSIQFTWTYQLT